MANREIIQDTQETQKRYPLPREICSKIIAICLKVKKFQEIAMIGMLGSIHSKKLIIPQSSCDMIRIMLHINSKNLINRFI